MSDASLPHRRIRSGPCARPTTRAVEGWSKAMEQMVAGEEFASASGEFLKRYVEMQESLRAASRAAAGRRHHRRHRAPRPARDQRRAQGRRGRGRGPRDRRAPGGGRGHARQPRDGGARRPPARKPPPGQVAPWRHRRTARARVPEPPTRCGSRRWCAGWESSRATCASRPGRPRRTSSGPGTRPSCTATGPSPPGLMRRRCCWSTPSSTSPTSSTSGRATASSATCCAGLRRLPARLGHAGVGGPGTTLDELVGGTCRGARGAHAAGEGRRRLHPLRLLHGRHLRRHARGAATRGPEEPRRAHGARGLLRGRHLLRLDPPPPSRRRGGRPRAGRPGFDRPRQQDAEAGAEPRRGIPRPCGSACWPGRT